MIEKRPASCRTLFCAVNPSMPGGAMLLPETRFFWDERGKFLAFVPPHFVLPPSDEGGGKPEGFDGGRDTAGLRKVRCPEYTGCEFSPSVACGDSSLVRGSQGVEVSAQPAQRELRAGLVSFAQYPLRTARGSGASVFPAKQVLRGLRLIKPPRSPEKPAPCGMTAALAAEARFAGRQRRRCGVSVPAGAELFPPADTVGPGSFDRISRRTRRLSSSRYYGNRARRGWSGGTGLR